MSINFGKIAERIHETLKGFGYELQMYDDVGTKKYDPSEARFFYINSEQLMVILEDDGEYSSIQFYISFNDNIKELKKLMTNLRKTANKFNLSWSVKKFGREITPKDFTSKINKNKNLKEWRSDLKENKIIENFFEQYSYSNIAENQYISRIIENIDKEFGNLNSEDNWKIASKLVENKNNNSYLRTNFSKLSEAEKNSVLYKLDEVWTKNISESVRKKLFDISLINETQLEEDHPRSPEMVAAIQAVRSYLQKGYKLVQAIQSAAKLHRVPLDELKTQIEERYGKKVGEISQPNQNNMSNAVTKANSLAKTMDHKVAARKAANYFGVGEKAVERRMTIEELSEDEFDLNDFEDLENNGEYTDETVNHDDFDNFVKSIAHPQDENFGDDEDEEFNDEEEFGEDGRLSPVGSSNVGPHRYFQN